MENKVNIADLLKDCPPGMELDCTMYDNVRLKYVSVYKDEDYPICIVTKSGFVTKLTKYGQNVNLDDAKCVIFPKGKTTWEGFVPYQFKDGDIVATAGGWIGITTGGEIGKIIPTYCVIKDGVEFEAYFDTKETWAFSRLATEEEKQKLFDAIKENGYKWDAETKTLEKLIIPKFKVGDRITDGEDSMTIDYMNNEYYYNIKGDTVSRLFIKNQDNWKLVPDKFDISTFVPFETKVLVRDHESQTWRPAIWGFYDKSCNNHRYGVVGGLCFDMCIPYEGNELLRGKIEDCDEFYKTW